MTSFKPGDRVTDGVIIGIVDDCPYVANRAGLVCVKTSLGHEAYNVSELCPAWQECLDCDGAGWDWDDASCCNHHAETVNCPTCEGTGRINRTGPYRLANGEWSDEVDRTYPSSTVGYVRNNPRRYTVSWFDSGKWSIERGMYEYGIYTTHAEAINYATRMAQQGDK